MWTNMSYFQGEKVRMSEKRKHIPSYNNCGNCTHNLLERLWHWQDHRHLTSEGKSRS